jgi:hypothetical protein
VSDEKPPQIIEDLIREAGAVSGQTPDETDERIRALREAWKTFSKPEVQEQVSQARYRGAGFVIYDERGYDIQLAKDSVGPGWASLIDKVFDAKPPDLRIVQVKEKYAGLRIYTDRIDKQFDDLLFDVQNESLTICEECGKQGLVREGGWWTTLCDEHSQGRPPKEPQIHWTRG